MYLTVAKNKTKAMTPDEERELARNICRSKLEVWESVLENPLQIEANLDTILEIAASKRLKPINDECLTKLAVAARRFKRRSLPVNMHGVNRARPEVARAMVECDPCMEIAAAFYARFGQASPAWKRYLGYKNRFIERNIGLVYLLTNKLVNPVIAKEDLFQEGVLGLERAVGKFEVERGFKFSTYASWWIRAFVYRYCRDHSRTVRLPINVQEKLERYNSALAKLYQTGEHADLPAIAKKAGITLGSLERVRGLDVGQALSTDSGSYKGRRFEDVAADPKDMIASLENEYDLAHVREILLSLPERQRLIMHERFGFDGSGGRTLQEIANDRSLTRERVRQIQENALKNMRAGLEIRLNGSEILPRSFESETVM